MNPILSAFLGSAITSLTSIITIILTNRHNTRIVEKQIKSTENQVRLQYRYEDDKIVKNLNYQNKVDRKSTRLNSSHAVRSRMPSSA